jgi:molybdopterin-containing oxidoreductase family membrane subunit
VFGIEEFHASARRAIILAIIMLICGFGVIAMELEKPITLVIYAVLSPNLESPMWWMGALYGVYLGVLVVEFYYCMKANRMGAFYSGLVGFVLAIAAPSNLGGVFGLLAARPFWGGVFSPVYLVVTALISGTALMGLVHYLKVRCRGLDFCAHDKHYMFLLGRILALLIGILMFLTIWKSIVGIYQHQDSSSLALMTLLSGPLAFNFWVFEVIIGMVLPFAMILTPAMRTPLRLTVASCLSLIGMFFMRYDYVVAGQLVPVREGTVETAGALLSYAPSITEIGIIVGAFALCMFLYTLAEKIFDLEVRHVHLPNGEPVNLHDGKLGVDHPH